jgi:hypothetical protein
MARRRAEEAQRRANAESGGTADSRAIKREITSAITAADKLLQADDPANQQMLDRLIMEAGSRIQSLSDSDRWFEAEFLARQVAIGELSVQGLHLYADIQHELVFGTWDRSQRSRVGGEVATLSGEAKGAKIGNALQITRLAHAIGKSVRVANSIGEIPLEFLKRINALEMVTREGRNGKFTTFVLFPKVENESLKMSERIVARLADAAVNLPVQAAVEIHEFVAKDRKSNDEQKRHALSAISSSLDELDEKQAFRFASLVLDSREATEDEKKAALDRAFALVESAGEKQAFRLATSLMGNRSLSNEDRRRAKELAERAIASASGNDKSKMRSTLSKLVAKQWEIEALSATSDSEEAEVTDEDQS